MRLSALFATLLLLALAACDTTSSTIPVFGDPYTVNEEPGPVLDGDSLRVRVSYGGGCEAHEFDVRYSVSGSEIWLYHDANDDSCEAFLSDSLVLPVRLDRLAPSPRRFYIRPGETIELRETSPSE